MSGRHSLRRQRLDSEMERARSERSSLELIVEVSDREAALKELSKFAEVVRVFRHIPYIAIRCDVYDAEAVASGGEGSHFRFVRGVDASSTFHAKPVSVSLHSNSVRAGSLWNLEDIGAYEAQELATGSGIRLGIIDSGVNYRHPELRERFGRDKGRNFPGNRDPMDDNGHGTHVAGIAAARHYGVSRETELQAIKVLNQDGAGNEVDVIAGIEYAFDRKCHIANMSLGSEHASKAFEDICQYVTAHGLLLVAAAGNNGDSRPIFPGSFRPVIAVAAVARGNRHAEFSNIYETNDITAPGVDIVSPYLDSYASLSGTSMAAPHVSGALSLGLSVLKKELSIEDILERTAQPLESGDTRYDDAWVFGAGLLRADRLVQQVLYSRKLSQLLNRSVLQRLMEW